MCFTLCNTQKKSSFKQVLKKRFEGTIYFGLQRSFTTHHTESLPTGSSPYQVNLNNRFTCLSAKWFKMEAFSDVNFSVNLQWILDNYEPNMALELKQREVLDTLWYGEHEIINFKTTQLRINLHKILFH